MISSNSGSDLTTYYMNMDRGSKTINKPTLGQKIKNTWREIKKFPKLRYLFIIATFCWVISCILQTVFQILFNINFDRSYSSIVFNTTIDFSAVILLWNAIDALINENELQLVMVVGYSVVASSFVVLNGFMKIRDILGKSDQDFIFAMFILGMIVAFTLCTLLCEMVLVLLFYPIYKSFGWKIYKSVGSNPNIQRYWKVLSYYKVLLKVDISFSLVLIYCSLMLQPIEENKSIWFYVILGVFYVFLFLAGFIQLVTYPFFINVAVKRESYPLTIAGMVSLVVFPLYLFGKLIYTFVVINNTEYDGYGNPFLLKCNVNEDVQHHVDCANTYLVNSDFTYITMTTLSVAAIILRIIVIIFTFFVIRNYRKGLRERLLRNKYISNDRSDIEKVYQRTINPENEMDTEIDDGTIDYSSDELTDFF